MQVAKRRVAMDADGTTLPAADVRALLADRSSLVDRSVGANRQGSGFKVCKLRLMSWQHQSACMVNPTGHS